MIELYQVHAILQIATLISFIGAVYKAWRHQVDTHHKLIYTAVSFNTLAVLLMIYGVTGLPTLHCRMAFSIYLFIVITTLSGKLFVKQRLRRIHHKLLAISAILLFIFMVVNGLITFIG